MPATVQRAAKVTAASARLFRVLGHPTRLAILELLLDRPHGVSELVEALESSQSQVSNHLACLRWCGFVDTERQGRQVIYRVIDRHITAVLDAGRDIAVEHSEHLVSCTRIGPDWI